MPAAKPTHISNTQRSIVELRYASMDPGPPLRYGRDDAEVRSKTGTLHWLRDLASGGEAQIDRRELADRLLVEGDAEPGAGRQSG